MKNGTILKKDYHPEWTQLMLLPLVISNGKTTTTVFIPYWVHHNESWSIKVRGISTKGDSMNKTFWIDKLAFDTLSIGEFICPSGLCDYDSAMHKTKAK